MKRALVAGAGGFIGHALVKRLKLDNYYVIGVDIKNTEFSETQADVFHVLDLRERSACNQLINRSSPDEVYQLAADMGGMGFIHSAESDIMRNNALINLNMIDVAARYGVPRYFFSSSVCVYPDMEIGAPMVYEDQAYPANPDNEYGWEKLYAERMAMAYGRKYNTAVRIARFQNCFGPEGTWRGGREKAPAALCRKIAEVNDGDTIEVWGDGTAVRSYTYVNDMVDGIVKLMRSDLEGPTNIGNPEYISVFDLICKIANVAGKAVCPMYIDGPVGVQSRNFSIERILSTGWKPQYSTLQGIGRTYPWIEEQVKAAALK